MKKIIFILVLLIIGIVFIIGCAEEIKEKPKEKLDCPYECCIDKTYEIKICPAGYGCKADKCVEIAQIGEVQVYKGIWMPMVSILHPSCFAYMMQELKDMGTNTVFLSALAPQPLEERVPLAKEHIIANIQTAHLNGQKVALTTGYKHYPHIKDVDLEALNSRIIEYAKLAEEYGVEFFAPLNEPEAIFEEGIRHENPAKFKEDAEKRGQEIREVYNWGQEILPKIREVYHGEVIWKGGSIGDMQPPCFHPNSIDLSGYDYFGYTMSPGAGMTIEEFSQRVDHDLNKAFEIAERSNVKKVIISEFYGEHMGERGYSKEEIARVHEIVLEKGKDKVVGFFILGVRFQELYCTTWIAELLDQSEEVTIAEIKEEEQDMGKTKEMIKKWFNEELK